MQLLFRHDKSRQMFSHYDLYNMTSKYKLLHNIIRMHYNLAPMKISSPLKTSKLSHSLMIQSNICVTWLKILLVVIYHYCPKANMCKMVRYLKGLWQAECEFHWKDFCSFSDFQTNWNVKNSLKQKKKILFILAELKQEPSNRTLETTHWENHEARN